MKCVLGDIADVMMGQSPKSEFYNYDGQGIPFLQGNRTFGKRYPVFDTYTTKPTKIAKTGDIIMSVRAPVGDLNFAPADICLGRGVCGIRMKNGNQDFLFYLLKYYMPQLLKKESGTVFGSINRNDINRLELAIPDKFEHQQRIARALTMLDEKIEKNDEINDNLLQQSQAMYKSWFIDYEPFDGVRPTDWIFGTIDDLAKEVVCGKTPSTKVKEYYSSDVPFITIPDMHGNTYAVKTERYLSNYGAASQAKKTLPPNSICVSCIGTAGLVTLVASESQTNQQINSIIPKDEYSPFYIFLLMQTLSEVINKLGQSGSTIVNLNKAQFGKIKVTVPAVHDMKAFDKKVAPLFALILANQKENIHLSSIRETLLPRLMSGELDVSDLDL